MKSKILAVEIKDFLVESKPLDKERVVVKVTNASKELVFIFHTYKDKFFFTDGSSNNQNTAISIIEDLIIFNPSFMDENTIIISDRKILINFFYKEFNLDVEIESIRIFDYTECPKAIKFSDTFRKIKALLKEEKSQ